MKKSQVSFEFVVLFAILFFIFIAIAGFFPSSLKSASSTNGLAESLAKEIKVNAITASLSRSNFSSEISIPNRINSAKIQIDVYASPDNMLIIKDMRDNEQLARVFLPRVDSINDPDPNPSLAVRKLIISKDVDTNNLSIEIIRET